MSYKVALKKGQGRLSAPRAKHGNAPKILMILRSERMGELNQLRNGLDEEKLLRAQEAEVTKKALAEAVQVQFFFLENRMPGPGRFGGVTGFFVFSQ